MNLCIDSTQLRKALADIEAAEKNGFMHCLAVFRLATAGYMLQQCTMDYSDIIERAHPTDSNLNWGRHQGVSRRFRYQDGHLVPTDERSAESERDKPCS